MVAFFLLRGRGEGAGEGEGRQTGVHDFCDNAMVFDRRDGARAHCWH